MNEEGFNNPMENSGNSKDFEYDRPLKKAKYVWQLKGKYHLKDINKNDHTNYTKIKENMKRKYLKEKSVGRNEDDEGNFSPMHILRNPNPVLSKKEDPVNKKSTNISDDTPISMVLSAENNEKYLHKWQIKRIEESFVENAINTMLEHLGISPTDAADFVENCTNGGEIVDEGILMAIQSHGLRPTAGIRENYLSDDIISRVSNDEKIKTTNDVTGTNSMKEYINRDHIKQAQISTINNNCFCEFDLKNQILQRNNGNYTSSVDDTVDFLSTAVSVAIEKKGLSYSH